MSGLGFSAWTAAWLASLAVPVVVFYFLKLKRVRLAVPSLVLWQQVMEDKRVNAPFQKFKRNLLLWLQLLLLLLLVLAAMQPYWQGAAQSGERLLIMLDRSASMAALDRSGGTSRFNEAVRRIRERIDQLGGGQELAIIAFSRTATQASGFESNPRLLHQALDKIEVEDTAADLEDALRMAEAMGRSAPVDRVLLISDGNFPAQLSFQLPFQLDFEKLAPGGMNLGITDLNARRTESGWALFAGLRGSQDFAGSAKLELRMNGELAGFQDVVLRTDGTQRLVFPLNSGQVMDVELRLSVLGFDSLESDNTAHLHLVPPRLLEVEVPEKLAAFRHALKAQPLVRIWPDESQGAAPLRLDLKLTDEPAAGFENSSMIFQIGQVPDDLKALLLLADGQTTVVDWHRTAPLLEHVELKDLLLLQKAGYRDGADEQMLENLGYQVLAYAESAPYLLRREQGQRLQYVMLCQDDRSTLPYRIGFPILISNLVREAMHRAQLLEIRAPRTGVLPVLHLAPGGSYTVTGPGGFSRQEPADSEGLLNGIPAPRTGRYTVQGPGGTAGIFGVSLLQGQETSLEAVEEIALDRQRVVAAQQAGSMDRPLWHILAVLALCVLVAEWWFFQRRTVRMRQ